MIEESPPLTHVRFLVEITNEIKTRPTQITLLYWAFLLQ